LIDTSNRNFESREELLKLVSENVPRHEIY